MNAAHLNSSVGIRNKMLRYGKLFVICAIASVLVLIHGCHKQIGDYIALSSVSKEGFARNREQAIRANGQQIRVWGYVDHQNIYANNGEGILHEWWSGDGPTPTTWRFNLKAKPDDKTGHSIWVIAPNDQGRDALLRAFLGDARAGRPTRVFVEGKILIFDAPANFGLFTGLSVEAESTNRILLKISE